MSAVQTALRKIKFEIPEAVLNLAFRDRKYFNEAFQPPIESRIRSAIIDGQVLPDCNLVGGTQLTIPLTGIVYQTINEYTRIYKVPKSETSGLSITSVLSVTWGVTGSTANSPFTMSQSMDIAGGVGCGSSPMLSAAQNVMAALSPLPNLWTANVFLISENTIAIRDYIPTDGPLWLRCMVSNDPELNNIHPKSQPYFAQLCVMAAKAYIYNNLDITLDEGAIHGGYELNRVRTTVDGYSDAIDNYNDFLNNDWRRIAFLNDPESKIRAIKRLGPPKL